jgi:hypothetical protein
VVSFKCAAHREKKAVGEAYEISVKQLGKILQKGLLGAPLTQGAFIKL